jgi:hypothetical protein
MKQGTIAMGSKQEATEHLTLSSEWAITVWACLSLGQTGPVLFGARQRPIHLW